MARAADSRQPGAALRRAPNATPQAPGRARLLHGGPLGWVPRQHDGQQLLRPRVHLRISAQFSVIEHNSAQFSATPVFSCWDVERHIRSSFSQLCPGQPPPSMRMHHPGWLQTPCSPPWHASTCAPLRSQLTEQCFELTGRSGGGGRRRSSCSAKMSGREGSKGSWPYSSV